MGACTLYVQLVRFYTIFSSMHREFYRYDCEVRTFSFLFSETAKSSLKHTKYKRY